jgi:hypothetical protein
MRIAVSTRPLLFPLLTAPPLHTAPLDDLQLLGAGCALLATLSLIISSLALGASSSSRMPGLGSSLPSPPARLAWRTLYLVGLAWAVLSTSGLMDSVGRDIAMHCGLAEALMRVTHLEEKLVSLKHDEMITQVRA